MVGPDVPNGVGGRILGLGNLNRRLNIAILLMNISPGEFDASKPLCI